jgi:hypothetical protein
MTGSISLYDRCGERQHTIYVGAAPEHGRASFHERMEREIAHVKQLYPGRAMSALPMAPRATGISWSRMWTSRFSIFIMRPNR